MRTDAHARPSGDAPEPLYDVTVPTPTHAERARTLVAGISTGTLCTLALEPHGYPYGSFVTVAFDEGDPVFLISALAEHTRNLERDPRASLLVAEGGSDDPLANGRVTMLGECRRIAADHAAEVKHAGEAFFAVHQNARYYADFRDFAFSKLRDVSSATMTGIDRYGFEMSARTAQGPRPVRLGFPRSVATPEEARAALIAMLNQARAQPNNPSKAS